MKISPHASWGGVHHPGTVQPPPTLSTSAPPPHPTSIQNSIKGGGIIVPSPCIQDLFSMPHEDLTPCIMGGVRHTGAVQPPSALGWVKQSMGVRSKNLVQGFYSMFTKHNTPTRAASYSMENGSQHNLIDITGRSVTPTNKSSKLGMILRMILRQVSTETIHSPHSTSQPVQHHDSQ